MEKYSGYIRKPFYYETDKMGIVHHSNYIRWFEETRVAFLEFLGCPFEKIEEQGLVVPVLDLTCQYKNMVRFGDEVRIFPIVEAYTGVRWHFRYEAFVGDQLVATGTSQHCFLDGKTHRLVQLKKTHPQLHQIFADTVQKSN